MSEPRTGAGRRLHAYITSDIQGIASEPEPNWAYDWAKVIGEVEAEARADLARRIEARVERLETFQWSDAQTAGTVISKVFAAIREEAAKP